MTNPIHFHQEPARILVVMPTWVGDVVMATPFVRAVFTRFSEARISLLMYAHVHGVLEGTPWVEQCYFWPPKSTGRAAQKAFIKTLREENFDLAILLPNSFRVAWTAFRIGAKRRVGFDRDGRKLLLTDALTVPNKTKQGYQPMPLVEYYTHLARTLGCEDPGDQLQLVNTLGVNRQTQARLVQEGVSEDTRLVVICPGANFGASKCWHPERFAAVADQLVQQAGVTVVISPGPGEEPMAEAIASAMQYPSTLLVNPCLTLAELKSLIDGSALLLGNDTGPRHFARAFDIPRVTIFGPTEVAWTDTTHDQETIVRVDVPCGPCHQKVCPQPERICMDRVTVDAVTRACLKELAGTRTQIALG